LLPAAVVVAQMKAVAAVLVVTELAQELLAAEQAQNHLYLYQFQLHTP
jgi:recombinational DNA repair protein (RecF pathway)